MAINDYGLDAGYFKKNLEILVRDIDRYSPEEMERALGRLKKVAWHQSVMKKACGGKSMPRMNQ